jgi:hypothetical protein
VKEKLLEGHNKEPDLPFLIGFNWDQEKIGRLPTMQDLESLNLQKPVSLHSLIGFLMLTKIKPLDILVASLLAYSSCKHESL